MQSRGNLYFSWGNHWCVSSACRNCSCTTRFAWKPTETTQNSPPLAKDANRIHGNYSNSLPLANDANRIHGNYSCTSQNLLIGPFIHEVIERLANGGVCCASYVVSLSFVRKTVLLSTSRRATRGVEQIKASSIDDGRRRRSHERAGRLDDNS